MSVAPRPRSARRPRRRALLVGIDEYPGFGPECRLEGAVRDALALADLLIDRHGFAEADVACCLGAQATRQGILAAMERLRARLEPGDQALFFFSGHGSQMTDREGDEGDGLDETLVPCDSARSPGPNRDITDDEIHLWSVSVLERTPHLVLLFDCCHSATLHRPLWSVRSVVADRRPVHQLPPSPVGPRREIDPGLSPVVLSACLDSQRAYELPATEIGQARGLFSHHLGFALAEAGPATTWREVAEQVRAGMASWPVKQTSQESGPDLDTPLFGGGSEATRTAVGSAPSRSAPRSAPRSKKTIEEAPSTWPIANGKIPDGWRLDLYRSRGGPWLRVEDDPARARLFVGDRLRFDLRHDHRRKLFVYALDVGPGGRVAQIFPELDGHEALHPGLTLTQGDRQAGKLELYWPPGVLEGRTRARARLALVTSERRIRPSHLLTGRLDGLAVVFVVVREYELCRSVC